MEKVLSAAVYGFTAHQLALLSPFVRKIWNVKKFFHLSYDSKLKSDLQNFELLIFNGNLDYYELDFLLSAASHFIRQKKCCIAFNPMTEAAVKTLSHYDVPIVFSDFKGEEEVSDCSDRIKKLGSYRTFQKAENYTLSCENAISKLSASERYVLFCMLKGMKQDCIAREMGVASSTVGTYFSRIYRKCHVQTRNELYSLLAV